MYEEGKKTFDSIADALINSDLKYTDILNNLAAQRYILKRGIEKLNTFRADDPKAGGLVVASSVTHAVQLAELLQYEFHQSVSVVSYLHPNSSGNIDAFKTSNTRWVVSVGMISEGTDIPRLQVCCFLSSILTEMNYRQVLGRILRKTKAPSVSETAWMFTFAEPTLVRHAKQLSIDIPDTVVNFESMQAETTDKAAHNYPNGSDETGVGGDSGSGNNLDLNFDLSELDENPNAKESGDDNVIAMPESEVSDIPEEEQDECLKKFQMKEQHFFEELVELCDYEDIAHG
jgi:superfamily II DNA or RNA helicase